jgi:2-polyprenyl-6-methoxyphenol hydroxylase-like FAD-dependent oxidoreductase
MAGVRNVLIGGGGVSGMALAIGLRRTGIESEIVEVSSEWSVLGVGISLQGPALRALKVIGVIDRCVAAGFGYSYFKTGDVDSKVPATVELPQINGPHYPAAIGIMRQQLQRVLQEELAGAGVPVRLGVTVASLRPDDDGVEVAFTDGSKGRYGLVVGADGANSKIRDMIIGPAARPAFTGQAVWRATVPRAPEVQARYSFYGPRNKAGFNPVSETEMYVYLVQNVPDNRRLPDDKLPRIMREQLADFGGLMGEAREQIRDPAQIVYRPVTSGLLPSPWYRGRVLLIGDAAHTTTPHLASGAGISVEDAIVLAMLLQSDDPLARILENFMTRRYERCRMIVGNSHQLGEWEKSGTPPGVDPVALVATSLRALAQPM